MYIAYLFLLPMLEFLLSIACLRLELSRRKLKLTYFMKNLLPSDMHFDLAASKVTIWLQTFLGQCIHLFVNDLIFFFKCDSNAIKFSCTLSTISMTFWNSNTNRISYFMNTKSFTNEWYFNWKACVSFDNGRHCNANWYWNLHFGICNESFTQKK